MAAPSVGIREFRASLAEYIDRDEPVAITRHGHTVGYFIPAKADHVAEAAALRTIAARLDALVDLPEDQIDAAVAEFAQIREGGPA